MHDAPTVMFQFYIFGLPRLHIAGQPVSLPPQPAALCAFLVLHRQRRVTREEVQAAFWPDASPARAQERLRRALYLLRRAIAPHTDLIVAEGAELAIAPDASLWVDYEAFEQALLEAYHQDPPHREALERAVALYTDDLLKDTYADWALLEREHARQRFLTALRHLLTLCQQAEDWNAVTQHAHTLLTLDPFQEVAHRALMRAYAATGDRSAALRQYQQCVDILQRELDTTPLPETTALYEAIRQGKGVVAHEPFTTVRSAPITAKPDLQFVPLVGREQELATIAAEWRVCRQGHSRLVLVTGAAGMGKTRLVEEAVRRIAGPDVRVLTGHCYAMEAGTPYQLIADLMRGSVEQVWARLSPAVRAHLAQIAPLPLGATSAVNPASLPAPPDLSVHVQEAVAQVVLELLQNGTGLWLITEDLHWADPASLAVLNYILRRCADWPLMVLATLRDEEVSFDSPLVNWPTMSVSAPAPTTLVQLSPLRAPQLEHLVRQLVDGEAAPLVRLLQHETAGNPFFVVETLRALLEQGVLYPSRGAGRQLRVDALPQHTDLPVSDVVLRVIRGRVRRLSRAAQELLLWAAVIEHDIDEGLLQALLDPTIALDLALDEVLRAHILEESTEGVYQFAHIKVREIIYADISAPRRRALHRRVAEVLSRVPAPKSLAHTARLAYHYAQARGWTPAVLHGWQAAQTAFAAGALAEANRYAEVTQDILDAHADELDPAALPETLAALRFDLLRLRAEFRRRAATAGLYYPTDLLDAIEALLPDVDISRQAQASLLRATHLLGQGDLPAAREAAAQGRALYAQIGDRRGELDAIQHQFDIAYRAGDMVTARRLVADLRAFSVRESAVQHMLTYNEMRMAVYEADWEAVLRLAHQLSAEHDYADPTSAWPSLTGLGLAYMKLGAYEDALAAARRAVAVSEEAHVLGLGARVLLAQLELWRGHTSDARRMLLDVLENPDPLVGEGELVSPALALVRCLVAEGDTEAARHWAQRASRAVSIVRLPILYPLAQVGWALIHLAEERYEDAAKDLSYPLEFLLLLADTSPQEIFMLRASAAKGRGNVEAAQRWLAQADAALNTQQARITEAQYRRSFAERVPLHRLIRRAQHARDWHPQDVLRPSL